ncbi:hypothetical protein KY321_00450, partial [Candidatus Woesearchaeota archaeon]|nr:hypothetical protein [Candidatus Woesearchaeota archaeon]
ETIEKRGMVVFPVNVEVWPNMDKDVRVEPGTYTYELMIYDEETVGMENEKVYHKSKFTIVVTE